MFSSYQQFPGALPAGGTTLTAATELAYQQAPPANVPPSPQGVVVKFYINATGGATGGNWTIRCRRGIGTGGAQVGNTQTVTVAASAIISEYFTFVDTAPPVGQNGVYTVTVTAVGSNGTANDGSLEVTVPVPFGGDS